MNMGERLGTLLSAPGEYVESWSPFYGGAPGTPTRAWGPDVQEILYTSSVQGPPARVQAVQPDGTHRRFLAEAGGFALSRDGSYAYYVGAPDTTTVRTLYRVPRAGGNPEPILVRDSLAGPVLSPGNRFVLYQVWREGPDPSIWVYDLQRQTSRHLLDGTPLVQSPDGERVLFRSFASEAYAIANLDDGTISPASISFPDLTYGAQAFRWDDAGIHILVQKLPDSGKGPTRLYSYDVATAVMTEFYAIDFDGVAYPPVWSADGTRVAFMVWDCLKASSFLSCDQSHTALYAVDVATGHERWVAGTSSDDGLGAPLLAPDGSFVAYMVGTRLYASPVP